MKSGRKTNTEWQQKYRNLVQVWDVKTAPLARSWQRATGFLQPGKAAEAVDEAFGNPDRDLATFLFVLAAFITLAFSIISILETVQLNEYTTRLLADMGITAPPLDLSNLNAMLAYQYIIYVPVALLFVAAQEVLVYWIARATGGKGDFGLQFYLSSLVALSMAFLSVLDLFMPVSCINIVALGCLVLGTAYLSLYINSRIYAKVHSISYFHALAINIVVSALRMAVLYFLTDSIMVLLGLPTAASLI